VNVVRLRQVARRTRSSWAALVVVSAGLVSAVAAIANLTLWVALTAAVAAVLGGLRVLQTELLVPVRIETVERATVRLRVNAADESWRFGTALHIGKHRWLTAAHLLTERKQAFLSLDGRNVPADVVHIDVDHDLAVITVADDWAWWTHPLIADAAAGDKVKAIGWKTTLRTEYEDGNPVRRARRISLDFTVDGVLDSSTIVLAGSFPPIGFSGAPIVNLQTGRVLGLITGRAEDTFEHLNETYAVPLANLPASYRWAPMHRRAFTADV
jgi:S1-C subfamily serine protease